MSEKPFRQQQQKSCYKLLSKPAFSPNRCEQDLNTSYNTMPSQQRGSQSQPPGVVPCLTSSTHSAQGGRANTCRGHLQAQLRRPPNLRRPPLVPLPWRHLDHPCGSARPRLAKGGLPTPHSGPWAPRYLPSFPADEPHLRAVHIT